MLQIEATGRVKPFALPVTMQTIYKTMAQPYFNYCYFDNCGKLLQNKLQKLQIRAVRMITEGNYDVRSADVLDSLKEFQCKTKSILGHKAQCLHCPKSKIYSIKM